MVQAFLGRLPMGFKVVILSPHGFFGQQNVLGKPDTGGQVCAIPVHSSNHLVQFQLIVDAPCIAVFVGSLRWHP